MQRRYYIAPNLDADANYEGDEALTRKEVETLDESNLVGSKLKDSTLHAPAIDIDLPCRLVESRKPGHFHLYIDKEMSWTQYTKILLALTDAGIIEEGYLDASLKRGQTFLRTKGLIGA